MTWSPEGKPDVQMQCLSSTASIPRPSTRLELPLGVVDGLDGPVELLAQRLGEELLDRDAELAGEDDGETRVDVVLRALLAAGKT